MEINTKNSDLSKIVPWNSKANPVKINTIRYNQDFSLLILGTSQGYKIFSTNNFKLLEEENNLKNKFGDIHIADLYYSSKLVFMLPSMFNKEYQNNELIIFDDYFQKKIGSIKLKEEKINNFFIVKDIIFIITLKNIIVLELYSLKVIEIIDDIAYNDKIISTNPFNYLAYSKNSDRKSIFVDYYKSENNKIIARKRKKIPTNFDFIQAIQFSPSGDKIVVVSIFGNKVHIYDTFSGTLKNCFFLGPKIQTIEKIFFSEKKPNYLLFIQNDKLFNIYKLGKIKEKEQIQKCICNIDNDQDLLSRVCEIDKKNEGLSKPRTYSKNKNIKEPHAYSDLEVRLLFGDFDRNSHKDLIFINKEGKLIKYHFNKKKNGKISPILSVQWI